MYTHNAPWIIPFVLLVASPFAAPQSNDAAAKLRKMPGVVIQDKEGEVVSVDFRNCNEAWVDGLPALLELKSVQSVSISGPLATQVRIAALAQLPNLKTLRLERNDELDIQTVSTLVAFPRLEEVTFDRCRLDDQSLKTIATCRTLKRLRIPGTMVSDAGLEHVGAMAQLELLDVLDCSIGDDGLQHLKGLSKMRNLSLSGQRITDAGLAHLAGMENMAAIALRNCKVTENGFAALAHMTKLKELDIYQTPVDAGALVWLKAANELTKLKMRASGITSDGIQLHINKFVNVVSMDLGETGIDDKALNSIAKMTKLEDLNLLRTKVTDVGVKSLTALKLKRLNLDDIDGITDEALASIKQMTTLEFLHLGKTKVTDQGMSDLYALSNLKDLLLNNTSVSEQALAELQKRLPKTKIKR